MQSAHSQELVQIISLLNLINAQAKVELEPDPGLEAHLELGHRVDRERDLRLDPEVGAYPKREAHPLHVLDPELEPVLILLLHPLLEQELVLEPDFHRDQEQILEPEPESLIRGRGPERGPDRGPDRGPGPGPEVSELLVPIQFLSCRVVRHFNLSQQPLLWLFLLLLLPS